MVQTGAARSRIGLRLVSAQAGCARVVAGSPGARFSVQPRDIVTGRQLNSGFRQGVFAHRAVDPATQDIAAAFLMPHTPALGRDHRASSGLAGPLDRRVRRTEFLDQHALAALLAVERTHGHRAADCGTANTQCVS